MDVRFDFSRGVHRHQFPVVLAIVLGLVFGERTPEHADNRATLQQRQIQRDLRDIAGGKPHHQEAALPGHVAQSQFGVRSADRVIDDIHALAGGDRLDPRTQVFGSVVDQFIGAVVPAYFQFHVA